jgi:Leucine-rich repeat (LRR) protein
MSINQVGALPNLLKPSFIQPLPSPQSEVLSLQNLAASFVVSNEFQNSPNVDSMRRYACNNLIRDRWSCLKAEAKGNEALPTLKDKMDSIEKSALRIVPQENLRFEDRECLLEEYANLLFRKLAEEFQAQAIFGDVIPVDLSSYIHLQQTFDAALLTLWNQSIAPQWKANAPVLNTPSEIRAWITNPANAPQLNQIKTLFLTSSSLEVIPKEITYLTQLAYLNLSGNQITTIPEFLGSLNQLVSLVLPNNKITTIPEYMGRLHRLDLLNLSNNPIATIPECFGSLNQLELLYLSNTLITTIPKCFKNLTLLADLDLSNNQITNIPECFKNLKLLVDLNLSNNQIAHIPNCFKNLNQLNCLVLSCNQITIIPECLKGLNQLEYFDFSNNPITTVPKRLRRFLNQHFVKI